jgi:hypothetical protein
MMKIKYLTAIIFTILMLVLVPGTVFARCPCEGEDQAPPQLDEQQASKWINSLHTARPYLARLWEVDQRTAEYYGAEYRMPNEGGWMGKHIETFIPISVKYDKTDLSGVIPAVSQYNVPPSLDDVQSKRWGQALPSARVYLARMWNIPKDN